MATENVNDLRQDRERLLVRRSATHDLYSGKAAALIAAGLVRQEQLPGADGMPTSAATFYDGQLMARWKRVNHDEKHLNIARYGSGFRVYVGVSAAVQAERKAKYAEREALEKERDQELRTDPGIAEATKLIGECSATFAIGEQVLANGVVAEITGEYRLRSVVDAKHGEFLTSNNEKFTFRPGYLCRITTGEEFFFAAHNIKFRDDARKLGYLQLVRSQRGA